jgi:uncharacterized membrane protein SpoIIM required for sporulation
MSMSAIRTIARREISETMTDWRTLTPIFILTFIVPQLLIGATAVAIDFIDDIGTVTRLVPFAMLLVGFIPASFSLISALESFVGERERNSIEALFAMPISDSALYVAKLFASLLPPLFSSFMAMVIFTISLRFQQPILYRDGLRPEYLVTVLVLVLLKAITMVAGAVIISSHTTSTRAANLLASFVLLPTATVVQIEALVIVGQRWELMNYIIAVLVVVGAALIRTGLGAFNREEVLSREHEQLNIALIWRDFRRYLAEYRPAGVPTSEYAGARFSPRQFYTSELPALLREYRLPLVVAVFAAICGVTLGGYLGGRYNLRFIDTFVSEIGRSADAGPGLAFGVFLNNIRVALLSNILSVFSFGTFAFLVPSVAFAQIGFVMTELAERSGSWLELGRGSPLTFFLVYVLPHGIIELPASILSAALGLRIGASLLSPPPGFTVGQNVLWALAQFFKVWALVLLPLFLIAGLVEGFITPLIIRAVYG